MGKDPEYKLARRFLLHPRICSVDDPARRRPYRKYFFPGREECVAQRRRLRCFEVGAQWLELLGGGRTARAQHKGFGRLPRLRGYRFEPAHREEREQDAATRRHRACSWNAGHAGAAIVCERSPDASHAKTLGGSVFEQAVKGLAGSVGAAGGGGGAGRSLLFHPHADRIEFALVASVLLRHPLGHRLRALETLRRIEVRALLARVQLKAALRALAYRITHHRQHRTAPGTARDGTCPRHLHRAGSECIFPRSRFLVLGARLSARLVPTAVLVSPLAGFSVSH